jgi:hypothetical protein
MLDADEMAMDDAAVLGRTGCPVSWRTTRRSRSFMAPLVALLVGAVLLIVGAPTAQAASYGPPVTIASGFNDPYGVAVDGAGDVFVADTGNNQAAITRRPCPGSAPAGESAAKSARATARQTPQSPSDK